MTMVRGKSKKEVELFLKLNRKIVEDLKQESKKSHQRFNEKYKKIIQAL